MNNIIPVTYLCWGCGSSEIRYEETDIPIPAREVWNICPECQVQAWEDRRREARGFKGNQYIDRPFVNSQNTTKELASKLGVGEQTASRIIQIHEKATCWRRTGRLRNGNCTSFD